MATFEGEMQQPIFEEVSSIIWKEESYSISIVGGKVVVLVTMHGKMKTTIA